VSAFRDIGLREWAVIAFVTAIAVSAILLRPWSFSSSHCTAMIVETKSALAVSDNEIQKLATADQATKCSAYRKRAAILDEAAPIARMCGPPQATRGAARPQLDSELSFYRRLVAEQCR